jgi:hypothetical protein
MGRESTIRRDAAGSVENGRVGIVETRSSTDGPVAINGRTVTVVNRTRVVALGRGAMRTRFVSSRPAYVEVLDAQGARHVVRVRPVERGVLVATALAGAALTVWRATRR